MELIFPIGDGDGDEDGDEDDEDIDVAICVSVFAGCHRFDSCDLSGTRLTCRRLRMPYEQHMLTQEPKGLTRRRFRIPHGFPL